MCYLFITGVLPGYEVADLHVICVQNDVHFSDGLALNKIHKREPRAISPTFTFKTCCSKVINKLRLKCPRE